MLELLEDVPEVMLVAIAAVVVGVRLWSGLAPNSGIAQALRRACSLRLIVSLLGVAIFAVVAEDVLEAERGELVLMLDHALRPVAQATSTLPGVRAGAALLSWLTGEGLALALIVAAAILWVSRRRAEAMVVVAGTVSAWGASGLFKLMLGVPRPRPEAWQYGFPSAHVFVTLVAFGLMAWVAGRGASPVRQTRLMGAAVAVAILTGCSRLLLDMHWTSDVIGGLAVGTVWLNATIALAERRFALEVPLRPTSSGNSLRS